MTDAALRIATRFLRASLADELKGKVHALLQSSATQADYAALAKWMDEHFFFNSAKTPRGQKALKENLQWFHRMVVSQASGNLITPEILAQGKPELAQRWRRVEPELPNVQLFARVQDKLVPHELVVSGNTYRNLSGFTDAQLKQYATRLESVFDDLKGWRRKALAGGLKVALAGPKEFRGTASGVYKSAEDTLYVRATPAVMKRSGREYAGFEYIICHEIGHRYEYKHRLPADFDKPEWWTTRYSRTEGEAFAELFALSNFNITSAGGSQEILVRFDALMTGHDSG